MRTSLRGITICCYKWELPIQYDFIISNVREGRLNFVVNWSDRVVDIKNIKKIDTLFSHPFPVFYSIIIITKQRK